MLYLYRSTHSESANCRAREIEAGHHMTPGRDLSRGDQWTQWTVNKTLSNTPRGHMSGTNLHRLCKAVELLFFLNKYVEDLEL